MDIRSWYENFYTGANSILILGEGCFKDGYFTLDPILPEFTPKRYRHASVVRDGALWIEEGAQYGAYF